MPHSKTTSVRIRSVASLMGGVLFLCALSLFASPAFAQSSGPVSGGSAGTPTPQTDNTLGSPTPDSTTSSCPQQQEGAIANPLKFCSLNELLTAILKAAIELGTVILTLAIVFVGFKFVAARGNEEKIRSAKTALLWTVIGGLILLGATAIQTVISSTVGSILS